MQVLRSLQYCHARSSIAEGEKLQVLGPLQYCTKRGNCNYHGRSIIAKRETWMIVLVARYYIFAIPARAWLFANNRSPLAKLVPNDCQAFGCDLAMRVRDGEGARYWRCGLASFRAHFSLARPRSHRATMPYRRNITIVPAVAIECGRCKLAGRCCALRLKNPRWVRGPKLPDF